VSVMSPVSAAGIELGAEDPDSPTVWGSATASPIVVLTHA